MSGKPYSGSYPGTRLELTLGMGDRGARGPGAPEGQQGNNNQIEHLGNFCKKLSVIIPYACIMFCYLLSITSFDPHSDLTNSFYRKQNKVSERLNDLPKILHLGSGRAKSRTLTLKTDILSFIYQSLYGLMDFSDITNPCETHVLNMNPPTSSGV